jgi:hypothetical protein
MYPKLVRRGSQRGARINGGSKLRTLSNPTLRKRRCSPYVNPRTILMPCPLLHHESFTSWKRPKVTLSIRQLPVPRQRNASSSLKSSFPPQAPGRESRYHGEAVVPKSKGILLHFDCYSIFIAHLQRSSYVSCRVLAILIPNHQMRRREGVLVNPIS